MANEVRNGRAILSERGLIWAEALNAGALREIASWCDNAFNALIEAKDPTEQADRRLYREASNALWALAAAAEKGAK